MDGGAPPNPVMRQQLTSAEKKNVTAKRATTYLWFLNHFHRPRLVQAVHAELSLGPEYSSATCVSSTCGIKQTLGFSVLKYSENAALLYHFNGFKHLINAPA